MQQRLCWSVTICGWKFCQSGIGRYTKFRYALIISYHYQWSCLFSKLLMIRLRYVYLHQSEFLKLMFLCVCICICMYLYYLFVCNLCLYLLHTYLIWVFGDSKLDILVIKILQSSKVWYTCLKQIMFGLTRTNINSRIN